MNRKLAIAAVLLIFILAAVYTYMGGFNSATVTKTISEQRYIVGQSFEGSVKDEKLTETFRQAGKLLEDKVVAGVPGSIYYNKPEESEDSLKAFIGVMVTDASVKVPEGFELKTIPGGRSVLRSEVNAHLMAAPSKLYPALFEYADENKLKLEDEYVEWFPEDRKAVVEVPVKR